MTIALPRYTEKDGLIMGLLVPLQAFLINVIVFKAQYFNSGLVYFGTTTLTTTLFISCHFLLCSGVGTLLKQRFPMDDDLPKKMGTGILILLVLASLILYGYLCLVESVAYFRYRLKEGDFIRAFFVLGVFIIIISFIMEGVYRYQLWRSTWIETERLAQAYQKSQLEGLKSQVNPHFLFNSLNTLSSLIHEDEKKAETFLDEMSKIYRYMLREETTYTAITNELQFVDSYRYLLKSRFGDALKIDVDVPHALRHFGIAPLSLQVLIENAFSQNIVSKSNPLKISISAEADTFLVIKNNLQPKSHSGGSDVEASLDHLITKYRLLRQTVEVVESAGARIVKIPIVKQYESA
jgi:two-component system, LytTR family, sensor kinase